jgi:exodeoxyribonuclease VII small subunit
VSDDRSTFETTRARLEDIVLQVRRKDVSLEQSLDMLEEAVRLVNQCNDLIDQTSFRAPAAPEGGEAVPEGEDASVDAVAVVASYELLDVDGEDIASIEFVDLVEEPAAGASASEMDDDDRS